ncbi:MAG: type III pantothenate kinase [Erysipelotrichaceae bacterium]|nr:type III pantothenate kinase [Erysipelotrichaceae bacterium]
MILAVDIGNTNISMGLLDGDKIIGNFRLTTKTQRTSDEYGICLTTLLIKSDIKPSDIEDVVISSVVPKVMYSFTNCIKKYLNKTPIVISAGIKTGISINTDNPKEVGADRIVSVAAAYHTYHRSCIIVDFGTATTFDYVSGNGEFKYTVISPGLEISAQALYGQTAKLPEVEIKKPESILGRNTITGMQSGIVYGYIGQVEYIVKKMKEELNDPDAFVIATGGLGRVIFQGTDVINLYDPDIAFKGIKILYEKNKNNFKPI